MGMFKVAVRVANPAEPNRFFEEDSWVDRGPMYSCTPEDRLEEIGLAPLHSRELVIADGRRERRLLGEALFTVRRLEETLTCPVVFGPTDSLYLLGATALENFGVDADPTAGRLKPILGIIGGELASRED